MTKTPEQIKQYEILEKIKKDFKDFLQGAKKKFISEHFTLFSVCNSITALTKGIDNRPTIQNIANATALAKNCMEKLFEKFGIDEDCINSWFRIIKLNRAIGSVDTSQHPLGMAVDFTPKKYSLLIVFNWIKKNLIYDQVILENGWIHLSYSLIKNRRQSLKLVNGKYIPA